MTDRRGGPGHRRRFRRPGAERPFTLLILTLVCWCGLTAPAASAAAPGDGGRAADESRIDLQWANRPEAAELRRMERWHSRWRAQAEPLDRLLGGLGTTDQPPPVGRRSWCRALAEALLAFDRDRAFPVPSYAAGRSLRRALDLLGQGAAACLEGRVYAASYYLRSAQSSFGDAATVLRPYGVVP